MPRSSPVRYIAVRAAGHTGCSAEGAWGGGDASKRSVDVTLNKTARWMAAISGVAVVACTAMTWPGRTQAAPAQKAVVIRAVPTLKKVVALTFDDGPTRTWTPEILNVLRQNGVRATFFVIGSQVTRFPQYFEQELKDHMEIGSHGATHLRLKNRSAAVVEQEIKENASILESMGAPKPTLYRLPAGVSDKTALEVLGRLGYTVIGWSIDPRDWRHRYTAEQMTNLVVKAAQPGSIVIFHDGTNSSKATVDAVKAIIPALKAKGYQFETVGQMIRGMPRPRNRLTRAATIPKTPKVRAIRPV